MAPYSAPRNPARRGTISVEGDPSAQILHLSRNRDVDRIALGTHGRDGVQRWALGSVTDRVLRSADVPLLVVRTPASSEVAGPPDSRHERSHF